MLTKPNVARKKFTPIRYSMNIYIFLQLEQVMHLFLEGLNTFLCMRNRGGNFLGWGILKG